MESSVTMSDNRDGEEDSAESSTRRRGGRFYQIADGDVGTSDADLELLRGAGYKKIRITNDRYRNSPSRMEFWKYGYQGKNSG